METHVGMQWVSPETFGPASRQRCVSAMGPPHLHQLPDLLAADEEDRGLFPFTNDAWRFFWESKPNPFERGGPVRGRGGEPAELQGAMSG